MKMEVVLSKRQEMEVMPVTCKEDKEEEEEEEEEEYPATFDDTDDENPPDEGDKGGGGEARVKLLKRLCNGGSVQTDNERSEAEITETIHREREAEKAKERDRERGGGGGRLRHRCFLNDCRGEIAEETHGEDEGSGGGGRAEHERTESESDKEIVRLKERKENNDGGDGGGDDGDGGEVRQLNTRDDSGGDCVVRHTSPSSPVTTVTTTTCNPSITTHPPPPPSPLPPSPTMHTLPHSSMCHRPPCQNYAATHPCRCCYLPLPPCSPCLPCQYHKQGTASPYHGCGFRCVPCQARCPYLCHMPHSLPQHSVTPPTSHHNTKVSQAMQDIPASPPRQPRRYTEGTPAAADAPSQERCPQSPSFSKDYITSLAFLARVDHVARVMADRSLPLKDLPQCPSPALCLILPQPRHPSMPHHHPDNSSHDLHRLQETLALCAGVGKGEVTPDLRHYCRSLLLAVLCPRSPPHEALLVENTIQELEGRAFMDHSASQVKYCWHVASSICLILERLGWVPSAH